MLFDAQVRNLQFAVRTRVVLQRLGQLFLPLAVLQLAPLLVWVFLAPGRPALTLAIVAAGMGLAAMACARIRATQELQRNEAMVITTLAFSIAPALLALPLLSLGVPWLDALFQAVSGLTTTGLSTVDTVPLQATAFHFYSAWMQWLGGLGVVVLAVAILVESTPALRRMGIDERETDALAGGIRAHARLVLLIYCILTAVTVALLLPWLDGWSAWLHALAAVSTGGFAPSSDSAAALPGWWPRAILAGASLAGAVSFSLYYQSLYRSPRVLLGDEELRLLLLMIVSCGAVLWALELTAGSGLDPRDAAFTAISAQTTTGFSSTDPGALSPASRLVLMVSMFIGGDVGSTAGGIKILRLLILLRLLELVIARISVARGAQLVIRADGKRITPREVEIAVALVIVHVFLILASWLVFLAHDRPALDALFDVVSAISLTGLSTGITSGELAPALKLVLCLDMLAGRVETIGLLLLLYPATWIGKRRSAQ